MAKHTQKVIAHARERLQPNPQKEDRTRAELLREYKQFLKVEEHRVRLAHKAGGSGLEIAQQRAKVLDIVLDNLFAGALESGAENSTPKHKYPVTLVATGGYGRGLLNPGSDVDLLFLLPDPARSVSKEAAEVIEQILYMLYDVGFTVGHATRSIKETIKQANVDHQTKCALIESRFITGDQALFDQFRTRFHKECINGKVRRFLADRAKDLNSRHTKHSKTVYMQEPNVKNGCGSLRDYQNLIWLCYAKYQERDLKVLVEKKLLSGTAYRELEKAYDFLMRVRNDMHYAEKRPTDILNLRLQGIVATHFEYPQKSMLRRCEEFMRDYYLHSRNLYNHTTSVMQSFQLEEKDERASSGIVSFLALRRNKIERFDGFYSKDDFIYAENARVFEEDPHRLMRLFQHTQRRVLRLSPEIRKRIKNSYSLIDRPFRYNKANRETFEAILSRRGDVARPLRQMHRVEILGRYLPEFGALTCLVQHEFFHRYTADEHTLKCIEKLDSLSDAGDPRFEIYQKLFHELEDPYVIYLALILHDTGRAKNHRFHADASAMLAMKVCNRLRITGERRRQLIFLVDHHLTLWRAATTKNIDDPNTIAEFARAVRNKPDLDALLLLTFADSNATSESGWSSWKESLILQLYHSTAAYFEDQKAFETRINPSITELKTAVAKKLGEGFESEIEAHFANMPGRYFRFRDAETVARHVRGFRQFFENLQRTPEETLNPILRWRAHPEKGHSELEIFSWDRPLFLARVAGALAARNINILGADIFTRRDDLVLDIFRVCTTNFEPVTLKSDIDAVTRILMSVFKRNVTDFRPVIDKARMESKYRASPEIDFPSRVYISNELNPQFTVLEIQTLDRIGLLYDIFGAIGDVGVETVAARINTEKGAAIDSFYLSDPMGQKITGQEILHDLKTRLEKAIGIVPVGA